MDGGSVGTGPDMFARIMAARIFYYGSSRLTSALLHNWWAMQQPTLVMFVHRCSEPSVVHIIQVRRTFCHLALNNRHTLSCLNIESGNMCDNAPVCVLFTKVSTLIFHGW